ncbi:MAG: polyprenyl synthetase family protein [Quinella sp. 2Q5]|nr:polyprenyl synthetase family protein [Quinella sp. 2Q5]
MFRETWKRRAKLVEENLLSELRRTTSLDTQLMQAMEYSLMAGGKRLRPMMLMAAADACGVEGERFITAADALEMIHTYSLIHDDLPAMDNDDYRRGKLTNHKVFGEAMAILAGDGLLTLAFEVVMRQRDVPAEILSDVVREISSAAGAAGMVGGQAIDLRSEGVRLTLPELKRMHLGKTGALFRAAIRSGAILAEADAQQLDDLTRYAEAFGLAFQITDDILDVAGDAAVLGKATGSDAKKGKATYVSLTSLEEARALAREAADDALRALKNFGDGADFLRGLVEYVTAREK